MPDSADRLELARSFLHPKSIAIVGASPRPDGWPERIVRNLERGQYQGRVFAVNPRYDEIWDRPCYPDISSLPEVPDQLVVIVQAEQALACLEEGGRAGVRSAIVYSGGFGEDLTEEGRHNARRLQEIASRWNLAICGPNCLGYASYPARAVALTERAEINRTTAGTVGLVAQSGGVATTLNRRLTEAGVYPRFVVSSGNELGLTIEDWVEYYLADPEIEAIGAFVESLKDPARFMGLCAAARDLEKPIVILKIGGSDAARRAVSAHTGRMAGSLRVFRDLTAQFGVISVNSVDEIVDVLGVYRKKWLPRSKQLGAVTVSGGLRGIFLESAAASGMEFPDLQEAALATQRGLLGVGTAVGNPVDSGFAGLRDPEALYRCVEALAEDPGPAAILVQGRPPESKAGAELVRRYSALAVKHAKPIILPGGSFCSGELSEAARDVLDQVEAVSFAPSADRAIRALSRLAEYAATLDGARDDLGELGSAATAPPSPVFEEMSRSAVAEGRLTLDESEAKRAIVEAGLRVPRGRACDSLDELRIAITDAHLPVMLKVVSASVAHKSVLGLLSGPHFDAAQMADEAERLWRRAEEVLGPETPFTVLIEEAVLGGLECALGLTRDLEFGLVMMFGTGGALLESHADVAFSALPASRAQVQRLVGATRIGEVLLSGRGTHRYDVDSLFDAIVTTARFALSHEQSLEALDLNPLTVLREGAGSVVLDASLMLTAR